MLSLDQTSGMYSRVYVGAIVLQNPLVSYGQKINDTRRTNVIATVLGVVHLVSTGAARRTSFPSVMTVAKAEDRRSVEANKRLESETMFPEREQMVSVTTQDVIYSRTTAHLGRLITGEANLAFVKCRFAVQPL